jgi:hypothetical protein
VATEPLDLRRQGVTGGVRIVQLHLQAADAQQDAAEDQAEDHRGRQGEGVTAAPAALLGA